MKSVRSEEGPWLVPAALQAAASWTSLQLLAEKVTKNMSRVERSVQELVLEVLYKFLDIFSKDCSE